MLMQFFQQQIQVGKIAFAEETGALFVGIATKCWCIVRLVNIV